MKTHFTIKKATFLSGILLLSLFSFQCRKSDRDAEVKNAAPIDNATAENIFNNVFKTIHSIAWENSILNGSQSGTSNTITDVCIDTLLFAYSSVQFPNVVVLDYGTTQSLCDNGYSSSGKMKATYSNQYNVLGSVVSVAFSNYIVDSMRVSGTMTITNKGYNVDSNYVFSIIVTNGQIIADTVNILWNCKRQYEWTSGDNTGTISDDVFTVSGNSNGRTSNGNAFDVVITTNLTYAMNCNWISQGIINMDLGAAIFSKTVNYGSGTCDKTATVSFKNTTYDIEMR